MTMSGCASYQRCDPPERAAHTASPPRACRTDGCTLVPDLDFAECCIKHDREYWLGGSKADRKRADTELRQCISAHQHPVLGAYYYYGVRAGGVPWLPSPWRWGFGWPFGHGYDAGKPADQPSSQPE